MKFLVAGLIAVVFAAVFVAIFVYSGVFDVAADVPHSELTARLIEAVRDRSIAVRIRDIQVPALDDPISSPRAPNITLPCAPSAISPQVSTRPTFAKDSIPHRPT